MSREEGLYKDKIEVSLDGRQIFYLFFGGAVIVGLVFVLGVMVGRRVEARGHVERAPTQAAVDPLAALDRLEGGGGLSFQGTLRNGDPQTSDVEKTIGEIAKAKEPAGKKPAAAPAPEVKKAEEPKVDKKVDEPKVDKKSQADEAKSEKKKSDDKKSDDKKSDDKKSDDVDKKASDKDFVATLESKSKSDDKPVEKKAKYTLQLSSFQDKGEAEAYLAAVKSNGFSPYITVAEVDGKTYYRIRLGNYRSVDAANDAKSDVEKATKKTASVMKL
jgi:cell division protein FtsN